MSYQPRPSLSEDLAADFERLLMTQRPSIWMVRPFKIEVKKAYATFYYSSQNGLQTAVLTFADMASIRLTSDEKGQEYDVEAQNSKGDMVFSYSAPSEAAGKEMVDILTTFLAAGSGRPRASEPPGVKSM